MDSLAGLGTPRQDAPRWRALRALFCAAAAVALSGALSGCGGGGGSEAPVPPPPPPAPVPTPAPSTPIAAQLSVPTPVGYDAERLAAFNRLNEIRLAAGLGMVAQSTPMDQAAQAHAAWMLANDSFTHEEVEGTVGFTGTNWARRVEAFGYLPLSGTEVMSSGDSGAAGIDGLVNVVYHRSGVLAFEPVDVGIGWSGQAATSLSKPLVVDMTRPGTDTTRGRGQAAQPRIDGVEIWPLDGALEVPIRMGLERPNPVPDQDVATLGTPASVTVAESRTISAATFVMTNADTRAVVPVKVLTNQNDANFLIPPSFIAAVPLVALSPSTTYQVVFSGNTVEFPSGALATINRTWSFTTSAR